MLNDGFQYLEQRDTENNITHEGVVGKYSAFATSDNKGIFDIVAEDLRALYDDMSSLGMAKLKQDITNMYNEMKNDPNWGTTTAVAQAQAALDAAKRAENALAQINEKAEHVQSVIDELNSLDNTMRQLQKLVTETKTNATNAQGSATAAAASEKNASDSAAASATSESNAKTYADNAKSSKDSAYASEQASETFKNNAYDYSQNAKASATASATSESNAKTYADNAKSSETNAKASATASATSELNAKSSENSAKVSAGSAKASADSASSSADLSKSWAVDTGSPDNATDTDSPTGKTQSSRTWALYSKENANNAASVASTVQGIIDNAVAVLRQELVSQSNLILHAEDGFSPKVKRISFTDGTTYAVKKAVAMATQPTDGSSVWFRTSN